MSRRASASERQLFESDCTDIQGARRFVAGVFSLIMGVFSFITGARIICTNVLSFMLGAFSFKWARQVSSVSYGRVTISETDWFGSALCARDNCSRSS